MIGKLLGVGITGKADDPRVIVMCLRVQQEAGCIKGLLNSVTPANHLGLSQRPPDYELIGVGINPKQLADVEVLVDAKVAVRRGVAVR